MSLLHFLLFLFTAVSASWFRIRLQSVF